MPEIVQENKTNTKLVEALGTCFDKKNQILYCYPQPPTDSSNVFVIVAIIQTTKKNASENVVCKLSPNLFQLHCVNCWHKSTLQDVVNITPTLFDVHISIILLP